MRFSAWNFIETPAQLFSCELCKSFKRATFLQKTPTKLFLHIKRGLNCYQPVEHGKYIKMFGERLPLNVFEQLFKGKMADDQCLKSFMGGARWLLKKKDLIYLNLRPEYFDKLKVKWISKNVELRWTSIKNTPDGLIQTAILKNIFCRT